MSHRVIAIGDIHGHVLALRGLLRLIAAQPDDLIVTLGDYVNRGPDTCSVIETLLDLQNRCRMISILGNHEEVMLGSRHGLHASDRWLFHGGVETLLSYGADCSLENIPSSHWDFLAACRPCYETEHHFFVHANYCWYSPSDQQPASLLRWTSIEESDPRPHLSGKTVILGHTPGPLRDHGYYRCLDTGCGFGGQLTAMEVNTGQCWHVSENGEPLSEIAQESILRS